MDDRSREAIVARLLSHHIEQAVSDDVDLRAAVRRRLTERAAAGAERVPSSAGAHPVRGWLSEWLAGRRLAPAALLAAVALIAVDAWGVRPQPVSAAEIVAKVQAAAAAPIQMGVQSFALTEATVYQTARGQARTEIKRWYQAPNSYQIETRTIMPGQPDRGVSTMVSDGASVWSYDEERKSVTVMDTFPGPATWGLTWVGEAVPTSLDEMLKQMQGPCASPAIRGTDTVAGRLAYVISLAECPSASTPTKSPRSLLWVDKQTFFVLRDEYWDGDTLIQRREVEAVAYDTALETGLFSFAPPAGVMVYDLRSKPAPGAAQYLQQLTELAAKADFPLFYPKAVPAELAPQAPRQTPAGLDLVWAPAAEGRSEELQRGVEIMMRKATRASVARPMPQAAPVVVGSLVGWSVPGLRNPDGTGKAAVVSFVRDGAWVSLSSFAYGTADLLRMAESLAPVPGGNAAMSNPAPWTVPELTQWLAYPVFLPAETQDLKHGAPMGGDQPDGTVTLYYSDPFGNVVLTVTNGPAGCCLDGGGRKSGQAVTLPGGLTAHFLPGTPESGGPILRWQQDGTYIALSGPSWTQDDLVRIAGTVTRQ